MVDRVKPELKIKTVVLGDFGVGKSSFVNYIGDRLIQSNLKQIIRLGADFIIKNIDFEDVRLNCFVWDTAGIEQYDAMTRSSYKNAVGVLILFDLTKNYTRKDLCKWIIKCKDEVSTSCYFMLIGSKLDLIENVEDNGTYKQLKEFCEEMGYKFYLISCLDGSTIDRAFKEFINQIKLIYVNPILQNDNESIVLIDKKTINNDSRFEKPLNYRNRISARPKITLEMKQKLLNPDYKGTNKRDKVSLITQDVTNTDNNNEHGNIHNHLSRCCQA